VGCGAVPTAPDRSNRINQKIAAGSADRFAGSHCRIALPDRLIALNRRGPLLPIADPQKRPSRGLSVGEKEKSDFFQ
jgi:hypothetical protein